MNPLSRPSDVAEHIATALDDNIHVPVAVLVQFELSLMNNPTDRTTREIYRDWLIEHNCARRAEQISQDLMGQSVHEYRGAVQVTDAHDWSGL